MPSVWRMIKMQTSKKKVLTTQNMFWKGFDTMLDITRLINIRIQYPTWLSFF
jgi:hypothetical protein